MKDKPTPTAYGEMQHAYDFFNKELFGGELPPCLITMQREKTAMGYFSPRRFITETGAATDEIAMNPTYFFCMSETETYQTLVHEMTHLWQYHFGKVSRGGYHNKQWADKMEEIGLMPSSTGKPGGKRTGDSMGDYPIEGGRFLKAYEKLTGDGFRFSWGDRFQAISKGAAPGMPLTAPIAETVLLEMGIEVEENEEGVPVIVSAPTRLAAKNKSNRIKYTCSCGNNVWGKPDLNLSCGDCLEKFHPCD